MYITADDIIAAGTGLSVNANPPASPGFLEQLIERTSRLFDLECGVKEGYFDATEGSPTNMTIYGDGTNYLKLPPYVAGSISAISMPTAFTVPDHIELDGYLVRCGTNGALLNNDGYHSHGFFHQGWPKGVPVTVTAKWGYAVTPGDVQMAIVEWSINVFRETDPASAKLVNLENSLLREAIPPRVQEVIGQRRLSERGRAFV